jgi:hypothetical protein
VTTAAAGLHLLGVPTFLAEHAFHLCAYSQTSIEGKSFSIRKDIRNSS